MLYGIGGMEGLFARFVGVVGRRSWRTMIGEFEEDGLFGGGTRERLGTQGVLPPLKRPTCCLKDCQVKIALNEVWARAEDYRFSLVRRR